MGVTAERADLQAPLDRGRRDERGEHPRPLHGPRHHHRRDPPGAPARSSSAPRRPRRSRRRPPRTASPSASARRGDQDHRRDPRGGAGRRARRPGRRSRRQRAQGAHEVAAAEQEDGSPAVAEAVDAEAAIEAVEPEEEPLEVEAGSEPEAETEVVASRRSAVAAVGETPAAPEEEEAVKPAPTISRGGADHEPHRPRRGAAAGCGPAGARTPLEAAAARAVGEEVKTAHHGRQAGRRRRRQRSRQPRCAARPPQGQGRRRRRRDPRPARQVRGVEGARKAEAGAAAPAPPGPPPARARARGPTPPAEARARRGAGAARLVRHRRSSATATSPRGRSILSEAVTVRELAEKLNVLVKDLMAYLISKKILVTANQALPQELAEKICEDLGVEAMVVTFEEEIDLQQEESRRGRGEAGARARRSSPSWDTSTTARPRCSTPSARRGWPRARPEASPSTSAPRRIDPQRQADRLHRHPGPRGVHPDARPRRQGHGHRRPGGGGGRRRHAADRRGDQPRPRRASADHRRHQQDRQVQRQPRAGQAGACRSDGVLLEGWGGEVPVVSRCRPRKRQGIEDLLEVILLVAEMADLKAVPEGHGARHRARGAQGARARRGRHACSCSRAPSSRATTSSAGATYGRVRAMLDTNRQAGAPGQALGRGRDHGPRGHPRGRRHASRSSRTRRGPARWPAYRQAKQREEQMAAGRKVSLEGLMDKIQSEEVKALNVVLKADVQGSVEVLRDTLAKLSTEQVADQRPARLGRRHQRQRHPAGLRLAGDRHRLQRAAGALRQGAGGARAGRRPPLLGHLHTSSRSCRRRWPACSGPPSRRRSSVAPRCARSSRSPRWAPIAGCMVVEGNILRTAEGTPAPRQRRGVGGRAWPRSGASRTTWPRSRTASSAASASIASRTSSWATSSRPTACGSGTGAVRWRSTATGSPLRPAGPRGRVTASDPLFVALAGWSSTCPGARSLKDKRQDLRSLVERLRTAHGAGRRGDHQDLHQRAALAVCALATDAEAARGSRGTRPRRAVHEASSGVRSRLDGRRRAGLRCSPVGGGLKMRDPAVRRTSGWQKRCGRCSRSCSCSRSRTRGSAGVVISGVELSGDRKLARAYFSVFGDEERERQAADGFSRRGASSGARVGRRMRMHNPPDLEFAATRVSSGRPDRAGDRPRAQGTRDALPDPTRSGRGGRGGMSVSARPTPRRQSRVCDGTKRMLITSHAARTATRSAPSWGSPSWLDRLGVETAIVNRDPHPASSAFLPGSERVRGWPDRCPPDFPAAFDLAVMLECPDLDRPGFPGLDRLPILNIDHHLRKRPLRRAQLRRRGGAGGRRDGAGDGGGGGRHGDGDDGDQPVRRPGHRHRGFPLLQRHSAGIPAAAELVAAGARPARDRRAALGAQPGPRRATDRERSSRPWSLLADGRLAMITCDRAMLEAAGAFPEDTESLINIPRAIEGVRVAVFFKAFRDGAVRVSLRSRAEWTCSRSPRIFGGGGHTQRRRLHHRRGPRRGRRAHAGDALLPVGGDLMSPSSGTACCSVDKPAGPTSHDVVAGGPPRARASAGSATPAPSTRPPRACSSCASARPPGCSSTCSRGRRPTAARSASASRPPPTIAEGEPLEPAAAGAASSTRRPSAGLAARFVGELEQLPPPTRPRRSAAASSTSSRAAGRRCRASPRGCGCTRSDSTRGRADRLALRGRPAPRAPTCAPSPTTSARPSAAAATSPRCGASGSARAGWSDAVPQEVLADRPPSEIPASAFVAPLAGAAAVPRGRRSTRPRCERLRARPAGGGRARRRRAADGFGAWSAVRDLGRRAARRGHGETSSPAAARPASSRQWCSGSPGDRSSAARTGPAPRTAVEASGHNRDRVLGTSSPPEVCSEFVEETMSHGLRCQQEQTIIEFRRHEQRHRLPRGAGRAPHEAHRVPDRALQGARQGPPLPPRTAHAGRAAAPAARVPAGSKDVARYRALIERLGLRALGAAPLAPRSTWKSRETSRSTAEHSNFEVGQGRQAGRRGLLACVSARPSSWSPRASDDRVREGVDFLPLTVDYREYTYAGGPHPGRLVQARGSPHREGDPHLPADRPPAAAALPQGLHAGDADRRHGALGRRRQRPRRARDQRRLGGADGLGLHPFDSRRSARSGSA